MRVETKILKPTGSNGHEFSPPDRPRLAVIVPAYNEARFIGSVVLQACQHADVVIVVDDGSKDGTARVAQAAGAIVVQHVENQGKGVALSTGFEYASDLKPQAVVTIDADGQHIAEEIVTVAKPVLNDEADIVIGSRYLENTSDVPTHRVWGHWLFNKMTNSASGVSVSDSQSGFRAFSQRAMPHLAFTSNGFSVESEMQFIANEHKLRMVEAPITIHYHDKPKRPVLAHGLMVLNGLLRLTGQYRPLLFFGLPGLILLLTATGWGIWVAAIYQRQQRLAMGYAMITVLLFLLGNTILTTGIILHSVRGLLLDYLVRKNYRLSSEDNIQGSRQQEAL